MSGHLFVIHGDLTRLACDAVLVPASAEPDITAPWRSLFEPSRLSPRGDWFRVTMELPAEWPDPCRVARVPERSGDRDVWLVRTDAWLREPTWVAEGLAEAVRTARRDLRGGARSVPLIGLALAGTGAGGLHHERGAVVAALVPALDRTAAECGVDIALVLNDERDHVAVQAVRDDPGRDVLDERQLVEADRLGAAAADGHLVLFLGAGVSISAGMPTWRGLIGELAVEAGISPVDLDGFSATDAAQIVHDVLGDDRFAESMRRRFTLKRHSAAHALLAG
ncbi:MAG TPA: hypothetical protein VNU26_16650, partial [Mycobacteriales bacterium]|nr:hypothetical protein [Mycobacteriales bacterium]